MVSRVGALETAPQLSTSVLKTPVSLNDSYVHEWLKISLCMLLDGVNHQSVFVIAQFQVQACLSQSPREMAYCNQQKPAQEPQGRLS